MTTKSAFVDSPIRARVSSAKLSASGSSSSCRSRAVVSPEIVRNSSPPASSVLRLSVRAVASQAIADLAALRQGAAAAGQALPTFTLEASVRFADAKARSAFTQELADAVADLVRRYHDDRAPRGRTFRFYLGAYPQKKESAEGD